MPSSIAHSLGLTLTKIFGCCYSMDTKQFPLISQVKDVQIELVAHLAKRMKLTILVADIPTIYGMLFSRSFCREMEGKIKMDQARAIILVGNKKIKLEPEEKTMFMVLKFDDPKAQILYQEMEFGNYMMFFDFNCFEEQLEPSSDPKIWTLEFDDSCTTTRSKIGIVLVSLDGDVTQLAYKLQFKNTNNIAQYETLLLGISIAK